MQKTTVVTFLSASVSHLPPTPVVFRCSPRQGDLPGGDLLSHDWIPNVFIRGWRGGAPLRQEPVQTRARRGTGFSFCVRLLTVSPTHLWNEAALLVPINPPPPQPWTLRTASSIPRSLLQSPCRSVLPRALRELRDQLVGMCQQWRWQRLPQGLCASAFYY